MPEESADSRERAARLMLFRQTINEFATAAHAAKMVEHDPEQFKPYDATVELLYGHVDSLGEKEMDLWNEFIEFIQNLTRDQFTQKQFINRDFLKQAIVRARNRSSGSHDGDTSDSQDAISTRTRHEFYGWMINLAASLELMDEYTQENFESFQKEVLDPLKEKLHLNG